MTSMQTSNKASARSRAARQSWTSALMMMSFLLRDDDDDAAMWSTRVGRDVFAKRGSEVVVGWDGSFLSRRKSRFVLWSAQRVCRRSIYMLRKSAVKSRVEFAFWNWKLLYLMGIHFRPILFYPLSHIIYRRFAKGRRRRRRKRRRRKINRSIDSIRSSLGWRRPLLFDTLFGGSGWCWQKSQKTTTP